MYPIPLILLHLFDGSSSSSISSAVDLSLTFTSGETTSETFFITSLDSSCMIILEHCWLTRYNPLIDWAMSSITFQTPAIGMPTPMSPSESLELNSTPLPPPPNLLPGACPGLASHPLETPPSDSPKAPGLPCSKISFVNAAAFQHACKLEGSVQFTLTLNLMPAHSTSISNAITNDPIDLSEVPLEYHDYADVFSKKKASTLASHRPRSEEHTSELQSRP